MLSSWADSFLCHIAQFAYAKKPLTDALHSQGFHWWWHCSLRPADFHHCSRKSWLHCHDLKYSIYFLPKQSLGPNDRYQPMFDSAAELTRAGRFPKDQSVFWEIQVNCHDVTQLQKVLYLSRESPENNLTLQVGEVFFNSPRKLPNNLLAPLSRIKISAREYPDTGLHRQSVSCVSGSCQKNDILPGCRWANLEPIRAWAIWCQENVQIQH